MTGRVGDTEGSQPGAKTSKGLHDSLHSWVDASGAGAANE